jgi:uncharacterized membrane protein
MAMGLTAMAQAPDDSTETEIGPIKLTFTTITVPGAINTNVLGINNNGEMVGYYFDSGTGGTGSGFLLAGGQFTFLNYPGADLTEAVGINDSGLISGTAYMNQNLSSVGFTYNGTAFTPIQRTNETYTEAHGINNSGNVAGGFGDFGSNYAFDLVGSRFRNVTPPPGGWITAIADAINNLGEIVGVTTGSGTNGFSFNRGKFQTITVPGSYSETQAWGVNDNGIVVGFYNCDSCLINAFALLNGKYLTFSYPGAMETFAFGINKTGQIVGSYTFDQQTYYGFVTNPITAADFDQTAPIR